MLLTDTDLVPIISSDKINKDPDNCLRIFPFNPTSLTPVGYDIRIGRKYVCEGHINKGEIGDTIKIRPKTPILISSLEEIDMPRNKTISGLVASKVSHTVKGLSHDLTTIDPDWSGTLLLSILNNTQKDCELKIGDEICTLIFFKNNSPSTVGSGKTENRNDLLIKQWENFTKNTKKKRRFGNYIPFLIIAFSVILGYLIFKNNPGFIATVAAGVAISQLIKSVFLD